MSDAIPGRRTTPAARPINTPAFGTSVLKPTKVVYRPGALDYQRHPSMVNGKRVDYHVKGEGQ